MINFPLLQQSSRGLALARAAEAMLRALGGSDVCFRVPALSTDASPGDGLGLAAPLTDDVAVAPAVVRALPPNGGVVVRFEVLLAPAALASQLAVRGQSAEEFLAEALGVLHPLAGGSAAPLLHIESVKAEMFAGEAYLYRVVAVG